MAAIKVNGTTHSVKSPDDTPLLDVLRNELELHGPKFGCGMAQCGVCSVLIDGEEARSCVLPVGSVDGKAVTTVEGLPAAWRSQSRKLAGPDDLHPVQAAWIDKQVAQCGYCQSGMMIQAASLLRKNSQPNVRQIKEAMAGRICRCGTHMRVVAAVQAAAETMKREGQ